MIAARLKSISFHLWKCNLMQCLFKCVFSIIISNEHVLYFKENSAVEKQCWTEAVEMAGCMHRAYNNEHHYPQWQVSKVYLRKVILGSLSQYILIRKMDIITILNQMLLKGRIELTYVQRTLCRTGRVKLYCRSNIL